MPRAKYMAKYDPRTGNFEAPIDEPSRGTDRIAEAERRHAAEVATIAARLEMVRKELDAFKSTKARRK